MNISDENINQISYHEKCDTVFVLVVRHFLERVEPFFETIILNGPLSKTNYFSIRVEFQVRGSPHVHSFIWILNLSKLTKSNIEEYTYCIMALYILTYQIRAVNRICWSFRKLIKSTKNRNIVTNIET